MLHLDLQGTPPDVEPVRKAILIERRIARTRTQVVVREHRLVAEAPPIYQLVVAADEPLPDGNVWTGGQVRSDLADGADGLPWCGEIVAVDSLAHSIYVATDDDPPCTGPARVAPYDYLSAPHTLVSSGRLQGLSEAYRQCLAAAAGTASGRRLRADQAPSAWNTSWGVVWGPPGTGKTYTLGRQVSALLADPTERVLVVSTTNRATDAAALELAHAARDTGLELRVLRRAGRVADPDAFTPDFTAVLPTHDPELLGELRGAREALRKARTPEEQARCAHRLQGLQRKLPGLRQAAFDEDFRAVVTTLHAALRLVVTEDTVRMLEEGRAPFTTVVVDEAGLVGRAQVAAVALLAAERVVLVGDPRQLSPIARASRSLPRPVMDWVARSAIAHLDVDEPRADVRFLDRQRRMHPDIRAGVSALMYGGRLRDDPSVLQRDDALDRELAQMPRLTWYVLDADRRITPIEAHSSAAPGRSRVRTGTLKVLSALFAAHPGLAAVKGLFISPYRAQARDAEAWLAEHAPNTWHASTVHAQQGAQAVVVVFDTVHASSSAWPQDEWRRLVNVGLSRAQHLCILVATRDEVGQPWMRPLLPHLAPRVLAQTARGLQWREVEADVRQQNLFAAQLGGAVQPDPGPPESDTTLGAQIERRRRIRPLLSAEQQALVARSLADGGPRLVRGVAGSGKTLVLAHWAVRALHGLSVKSVVIVFANSALEPLLRRMLDDAWEHGPGGDLPVERVRLLHIRALLSDLTREVGLPELEDRFDYEAQAQQILTAGSLTPRFDCVLVDETQDIGHAPLSVLCSLVHPLGNALPVMVFYDNAQNVYGRRQPTWSELGLDLRGRSDVMRESFRTTRPITEMALNVVDRLRRLRLDPDLRELMRPRQGPALLRETERGGEPWWRADYCITDGEEPTIALFDRWVDEVAGLCAVVRTWVVEERVRPGDIRVLVPRVDLGKELCDALQRAVPSPVMMRRSEGYEGTDGSIVVTTPQSFKGYDAEVVVVAAADRFQHGGEPSVSLLYVALTRARTVLRVTGTRRRGAAVIEALEAVRQQATAGIDPSTQ